MAKGVQAIKDNFQIVMEDLSNRLADSGDNATAIRELCEEWNSLQLVRNSKTNVRLAADTELVIQRFSSIIQKCNQMASRGVQTINGS